jgi:prolipoprotein diacylglyceryltransferase
MPGLALGHGFGRIGCFLAGCCHGSPTDGPLGVLFQGMSEKMLPVQLFEAGFEFALFGVMMIFYPKLKKHFLETYLFSYGVFRFVLEFFRGDNRGGTGTVFSPSQIISLIMIVAVVLLILYYKRIIFKSLYDKMAEYRKQAEKYGVRLHGDVSATLRELRGLQKDGLITQEEYEEYKKTLKERL